MLSPVHSAHTAHHFRHGASARGGGTPGGGHSGSLRQHTPNALLMTGGQAGTFGHGGAPNYAQSPLASASNADLARTPTWTQGTPTGEAPGNSPFAWTPDGQSAPLSGPLSQLGTGPHNFPDPAAKTLHDEVLKVWPPATLVTFASAGMYGASDIRLTQDKAKRTVVQKVSSCGGCHWRHTCPLVRRHTSPARPPATLPSPERCRWPASGTKLAGAHDGHDRKS